jgi:hypothetical protein
MIAKITDGDKRARSLLLNPRPKATKAQRGGFVISPAMTEEESIEMERVSRCVYYNKTGVFK